MEKITTYANNITAALEAERINILAPVPARARWVWKCPTA